MNGRSGRTSPLELAVVLGLSSLPFLPALHRGLVSEDFIILRRIAEQPFWKLAWEQLRGPWMGATIVLFWRPLSTFLLQIQELLWGVHPFGYLCVLLAAHLGSAALLFLLVRRLFPDDPWAARLVCLVFAVYPLHPNSVLFIASFATVYATTLCMAALLLYLEGKRLGRRPLIAASVLCYLLSLACYEGAFILPALLIPLDLLDSRERSEPLHLKKLAVRQAPFLVLAAGFLVFRHALLGTAIGGYSGSDFQLATLGTLLRRLSLRWSYLLVPVFDWHRPAWMELATRLTLVVMATAALVRKPARSGRMPLGIVWIIAARLPFGDTVVVPGNGRYWYLASAGIGFLAVGAVELLETPRIRKRAMAVLTAFLAAGYGIGLLAFAHRYVAASELVTRIRTAGRHLADPTDPNAARFLLDVPAFIVDSCGNNVAQVFAWGLADAFMPPFHEPSIRVFPLGSLRERDIVPLVAAAGPHSVWRWTGTRFTPLAPPLPPPRTIDSEIVDGTLRFRPAHSATCDLVTVDRMNPTVTRHPAGPGWHIAPLPLPVLQTTWHLYGDEVFLWFNGIGPSGNLVEVSAVRKVSAPEHGPAPGSVHPAR